MGFNMNMNMNKNVKIILVVVIICLVVIVTYYIYTADSSKTKVNKMNDKTKKNIKNKCDKNGCPLKNDQNDIYALHESYRPKRSKNYALIKSSGGSFFKQSSNKGPENVFIIRHGEKILSKFALDCNGILRSTYIPNLVENLNHKGYGINAIISINNYTTMHEQQTVMLTSWLLDIPIFIYGEQNSEQITIENVFKNPYYSGKNVLICWEHTCIQKLIQQIINIGPKVKGLTNYKFVNQDGNSGLPSWNINNYQSVLHFDDQLNFEALSESFTTCYSDDNDQLVYGVAQTCTEVPAYTMVNY
jgi:hypothetical protein